MNDYITNIHGFLPNTEPLTHMSYSHKTWDNVIAELPYWLEAKKLHTRLTRMPILDASDQALPSVYLERAAMILGYLAHGIAYEHKILHQPGEIKLPSSIEEPWNTVTKRLGRPFPTLTIYDTVLNNWRITGPRKQELFHKNPTEISLEDLEPLVTAFNDKGESIFHLAIVEMEFKAIPMIASIQGIMNGMAETEENYTKVSKYLHVIIQSINNMRKAFAKVSPKIASQTFVDPLVWVNTLAIFTQGFYQGNIGMSGLAVPSFHLLDAFFNRKEFGSELGVAILKYRPLFGKKQLAFIHHISGASVTEFLSKNKNILALYNEAKKTYYDFLQFHQNKVIGYLTMMPFSQRQSTNSGIVSKQKVVHLEAKDQLTHSQEERFGKIAQGKDLHIVDEQKQVKKYSITEVAKHNCKENGYWLIIKNDVLDLKRFAEKHPGGDKIFALYAGLDATDHFMTIHQGQLLANTLLSRYKIGEMEIDEGKEYITCIKHVLYEIVSCENSIYIAKEYISLSLGEQIYQNVSSTVLYRLQLAYTKLKELIKVCDFSPEQSIKLSWITDSIRKKLLDRQTNNKQLSLQYIADHIAVIKESLIEIIHLENQLIKKCEHQSFNIDIAVIGCGLGGLGLAIFLSKHNYHVTVFEKMPRPYSSIRTFNITLSKRGLDSLDSVGLKKKILSVCSKVRGREIHQKNSSSYDLLYGINESDALYSISRTDLIKILLEEAKALGVNFIFNTECGEYDLNKNQFTGFNNEQKIAARFTATCIFGADGAHSNLRGHIATIPGHYLRENTKSISEIVYTEFKLKYPGKQDRLHIWPRANNFLIAFPNKDGHFTFTLFVNSNVKITQSSFKENYPDLLPYVGSEFFISLERNQSPELMGHLHEVRFFPWSFNKALLFGDSVHAFYPFLGQAANSIFEDCKILSGIIQKSSTKDWFEIFLDFQKGRKKNINYIAALASKHAELLFSSLEDEKTQIRNFRVGNLITQVFPTLQPAYNLISFTNIPYHQAIITGHKFEEILKNVINYLDLHPEISNSEEQIVEIIRKFAKNILVSTDLFKQKKTDQLMSDKSRITSDQQITSKL